MNIEPTTGTSINTQNYTIICLLKASTLAYCHTQESRYYLNFSLSILYVIYVSNVL